MNTQVRRSQVVSGAVILLLLLAMSGGFYQYRAKQELKKDMDKERLHAESLLSEKLLLEKEMVDFRNQLNALSGQNRSLDEMLNSSKQQLEEKESRVNALLKENGKAKDLQKELNELRQMRNEMEQQVRRLLTNLAEMQSENDRLNSAVTALQDENDHLKAESLKNSLTDNYRVEALKKKKMRLTAAAKQANALIASFTLATDDASSIEFKITTPAGEVIAGKEQGISFIALDESSLMANLESKASIDITKRVEMTYKPDKKLVPGIYKIGLYNGGDYLGSCQVKLR